jgi:hypothetical protein
MMPHNHYLQVVGLQKNSAHFHLRSQLYLTLYQKVFFKTHSGMNHEQQ